ncbi:hypothetical protein PRIPAC_88288 [Pristionchus pacificus]|uniref:Uncharacterized protein n=1 Tax=Pristionchus pacificus TaxID=54126 RepID=A0A2A6B785_PRIPA|nr:hypothetical protein PRIPAC_88288 [Pristionchus pacificus]|eukprot:PDM61713.1 hypothetical protein PRIPAC_51155 [Pristionchus pacificus]
MRPFFLSVIFLPNALAISELCFKLVYSTVRRDSFGVVTTTSQQGCNVRCVDTPGCDACMFYADQSKCVLLGKPQSPPPGQCPISYACYEKAYSGCPMRSPFPADRGYTPGPCSNPSDLANPPRAARVWQVCGGSRRLFLDAILHDGTRVSLENDERSFIDWDPYIGSWFFTVHMTTIYFRSGYCIHPAVPALSGCGCAPFASIQQIPAGITVDTSQPAPKIDDPYFCPSRALVQLKRAWPGAQRTVLADGQSLLYCANGEWMLLLELTPQFNEASLVDVTCIL